MDGHGDVLLFSNYVWKGVFGADYCDGKYTRVASKKPSSDIYGFLSDNDAKAGDILWCHTTSNSITHNMIILACDSSGVWLSDGTSTGVLWHNNTKISYDDQIYKNTQGYFNGQCYLTLYKINDSLWDSIGSSSTKMYTINFNANGGTVAQTNKSVVAGSACGALPTPTRNGYVFDGWYTLSSAGTKVTSSTKTTGNMTLYAHWSEIRVSVSSGEWIVTIPSNYKLLCFSSSTATNSSTYISAKSSAYTLSCSKQAVLSNGKTRYFFVSGDNKQLWFDFTSGMKLESTLITDPQSCTVTFNANGGSVSPTTKTLEIGTRLTGMPTPTRTGYIFRGWAMDKIDPDGSGVNVTTIVADGVWAFDKDTTLYALWEKQAPANPPQNPSPGITKPTSFDYSGKFGVNNALTWGLNKDTSALVLSGNGKMQNWSNAEYRPWAKLRNTVTGVIIEDGIQNLGRYTLARCENMTSVSIPESVTEISDGVFTRAYSLGSIELPQSLTTIGSGAFSECTSLRSITIPKNVDFIETGAFGSCTNLESIYFCGNAPSYFGDNGVVRLNMFSICKNLTVYYPANSSGWTPIIEKYTDVMWKPWNPGNTTSPNSTSTAPNTTTWGTWSAWSSTPYSASGTREVETQQVKISDAYTEYRYGLWRNANNASWCPDYGASLSSSGGSWYEAYSNWSTTRMYKDTGHNAFCSDRSHTHTHVSGYDSSGWANWDIYSDDGTFTGWGRLYYYWEETRAIPAVYETQYRYRDLISA